MQEEDAEFRLKGEMKEGQSLLERHTLGFEAAERLLKREWRQRELIKVKRKKRNEQRKSLLTDLQDET